MKNVDLVGGGLLEDNKISNFNKFPRFNKKKAFSIAEALITLMIVGVAMGSAAPLISKTMKNSQVSNFQLQYLQRQIDDLRRDVVPIGTVAFFNSSVTPTSGSNPCPIGWTPLSADYNGRFPRFAGQYTINGFGSTAATTTTLSVGATQEDAIRNITGDFGNMDRYFGNPSTQGAFFVDSTLGYTSPDGDIRNAAHLYFDASRVVPTAAENRPKSIALLGCVKN